MNSTPSAATSGRLHLQFLGANATVTGSRYPAEPLYSEADARQSLGQLPRRAGLSEQSDGDRCDCPVPAYRQYHDQQRLGTELDAIQRLTRIVNSVEESKLLNRRSAQVS